MKIKASELTGVALDWAVAKCEGDASFGWTARGTERTALLCIEGTWRKFKPSTDWSQGGPIIDREQLNLSCLDDAVWEAWPNTGMNDDIYCQGPTALIAAMRCYVANKLGDEIEVPEELK